jgi:hypothetical protein
MNLRLGGPTLPCDLREKTISVTEWVQFEEPLAGSTVCVCVEGGEGDKCKNLFFKPVKKVCLSCVD